jgi:hypothetical protein
MASSVSGCFLMQSTTTGRTISRKRQLRWQLSSEPKSRSLAYDWPPQAPHQQGSHGTIAGVAIEGRGDIPVNWVSATVTTIKSEAKLTRLNAAGAKASTAS